MNRLIAITSLFLIITSCSKDVSNPELSNEKGTIDIGNQKHPSRVVAFCQTSLEDTLKLVQYEYNNDNLIKETTIVDEVVENETTFSYNPEGLLVSETFASPLRKTERTYIYNDNNQVINMLWKLTDYNLDGEIINTSESEAPREYENNQLIKEWNYWGGFSTYDYTDGKMTVKTNYTKNGQKHHIISFKYVNDLLTEEKKETTNGSIIYSKNYTYNSQNQLDKITDRGFIIAEHSYIEAKLFERRAFTNSTGGAEIEPCNGNYLFRYHY